MTGIKSLVSLRKMRRSWRTAAVRVGLLYSSPTCCQTHFEFETCYKHRPDQDLFLNADESILVDYTLLEMLANKTSAALFLTCIAEAQARPDCWAGCNVSLKVGMNAVKQNIVQEGTWLWASYLFRLAEQRQSWTAWTPSSPRRLWLTTTLRWCRSSGLRCTTSTAKTAACKEPTSSVNWSVPWDRWSIRARN